MLVDCFVDTKQQLSRPPLAISIGTYNSGTTTYPTVFGTYGNFSCITGPQKSMKTFLKTALVAGYIGGQSNDYFRDVKGYGSEGKLVIDIDTEQSKYDTQRAAKRVIKMVGSEVDMYRPFSFRRYSPYERLQFLEWLFCESDLRNHLGLVAIDGAADLIDDVNSLEKSNDVVSKMMKWTDQTRCHLLTVIHVNHEGGKLTGHLGSTIAKKAETVAQVTRTDSVCQVDPKYTRNRAFESFRFVLDDKNCPIQTDEILI